MNIPDNWEVIEFPDGKRRVFAGWMGDYLTGEKWGLNSGIVSTNETTEYYDFHGATGSIYRCYKDHEGIRGMHLTNVLNTILTKGNAKVVQYGNPNQE